MVDITGVRTAARRVGEVVALGNVEDVATGGFRHGQCVRWRPEFASSEENAPCQSVAHDEQRRGDQYEHDGDDDNHQLISTNKQIIQCLWIGNKYMCIRQRIGYVRCSREPIT